MWNRYVFTADSLDARTVSLNGKPLTITKPGVLPSMDGVAGSSHGKLDNHTLLHRYR